MYDDDEFDSLVTRYSEYTCLQLDSSNTATSTPATKSSKSSCGNYFLPCREHDKETLGCDKSIVFAPQFKFPNGRLPTTKQLIAFVLWTNQNTKDAANLFHISTDMMHHWISCNVYTITQKNVQAKLTKIMKEYSDLKKYPKAKKGDSYESKLLEFKLQCDSLFDIKTNDDTRIKDQEKKWRVKQTLADIEFYKNQALIPQVSF